MKKRLISSLLALIMVLSLVPVSAFAENETDSGGTETVVDNPVQETIGTEVEVGNTLYYIEDGKLLSSVDSARPNTVDTDVVWVREQDGLIYYAKIDGNNTDVYKSGDGGFEKYARLFCPIDAFDIDNGFLYYSYNGEVFKLDIESGKEETVMVDKDLLGFVLDRDGGIVITKFKKTDITADDIDLKVFEGISYQKQLCAVTNGNVHRTGICNVASITNLLKRKASLVGAEANYTVFNVFDALGCSYQTGECKYANEDHSGPHPGREAYVVTGTGGTSNAHTYTDTNRVIKCTTKQYKQMDRKSMKKLLDQHKEGVYVHYSYVGASGTHAVVITRYIGDTFYAIDPVWVSSGEIELSRVWNANKKFNADVFGKMNFAVTVDSYELIGHTCSFDPSTGKCPVCDEICIGMILTDRDNEFGIYTRKKDKNVDLCTKPYSCYKETSAKPKTTRVESVIRNESNEYWYLMSYNNKGYYCKKDEFTKVYKKTHELDGSSADTYILKNDADKNKVKDLAKREEPGWGAKIVNFFKNLFGGLFDDGNSVTVLGTVNSDGSWYLLGDNTYVEKAEFDKYYKRTYKGASSSINFTSIGAPSGTIRKGSYSLSGTISASVNIKEISAKVINVSSGVATLSKTVNPYTKSYSIKNSSIDYGLRFNDLSVGSTYYLQYKATDISGNSKTWTSGNFTVSSSGGSSGSASYAPVPNVRVESIEYGQRLIMESKGTGARLHMLFATGEHSGYDTITYDFITPGTYSTDVWTTKGRSVSDHVYNTFSVNKQAAPSIDNAQYNTNDATVTISGDGEIYYTLDGSTPSKGSNRYTGPIHITNSCTVKAISAKWGCANSDVSEKWQNITPPDTPSITLNTKDKLAHGKSTSVSWQPTARATSYTAVMYRGGTEVSRVTTSGTSASFLLGDRSDTENFEYKIKVYATNFKGNSGDSNNVTVWGMHPVKVTFADRIIRSGELTEDRLREVKRKLDNREGDGTSEKLENQIISVQKVDYDEYPSKPSTPSKKGFTFAGWTAGLYEPAITDKTVYGEFDINYYNVAFYDVGDDNKRMGEPLSSKKYMYTSEVELPDNYKVPVGYIFEGWNIDASNSTCFDLTYIDGNIIADAAYGWKNPELPQFVTISNIERHTKSYFVTVNIKNYPIDETQGRIVVSLYTDQGRNVYTQITEDDLDIGGLRNWTDTKVITLLYDGKISYAKAYVVAVKNDKTGGALSEEAYSNTITYNYDDFWTNWSEYKTAEEWASQGINVNAPTSEFEVKSKTQYRYRNKQTKTTNNTKNLSGWNYWYSDSSIGDWIYNGSNWVGTENSDYRKREVRTTWHDNYKTQWLYSRYVYGGRVQPYQSRDYTYYEDTGWHDYALPFEHYVTFANGGTYASYNPYWSQQAINDGIATRDRNWYNEQTRSVKNGGYNTYEYRDTYYTHHFWSWGAWSSWSDSRRSGDETQTREVYAYRTLTKDDTETEVENGYTDSISGFLPDMGTEYVTEEVFNHGKHEYVSGPYYIKNSEAENDDDKYISVEKSSHEVTEYRYGRYTNGSYTMPCPDCAEELYGGEWQLEWTDWSETPCDTINEDEYSCEYNEGHTHDKVKYEDGTDYWNEYLIGDQSYCFSEERIVNKEITYADPVKYYKVKTNLEGKVATVMVYKKNNNDPTQGQLEYVDQISIGEKNSYDFSINTKEFISYSGYGYDGTGDFIVTLAIQKIMRPINIKVIEADVPMHDVKFYVNGEEYRTEPVKHGEAVDLNNFSIEDIEAMNPGYRFVKWDKSVVDVTEDMDVNAVMVPKTYSVVFVDYENQTTELQELAFGETIPAPDVESVEGKVFLGWDNVIDKYTAIPENSEVDDTVERYYLLKDGETYIKKVDYNRTIHTLKDETEYFKTQTSAVVTGNMIITAQWDTIKYNVKFVDFEDNIISEQTVAHGESAKLPEFITVGDKTYTWDLTGAEWWNVTKDMVISPFDPTPSTVAPPVLDASLADVGGSFYASLSAADEEDKIYYTYYNEITDSDAQKFIKTRVEADSELDEGGVNLFGIHLFAEDSHEDEGGAEIQEDYSDLSSIKEYTEPIEITEGTVIYAFTVDKDGNISPIAVFEYGYDDSEDEGIIENTYEIDPDCPQITLPSLTVKPGETVEVPVSIKNNPGLTNLSLVFGYDTDNLTLVSATNGDVFANTEYSADTREDGNCKFTWLSKSLNENDGTLLTLTFKAGDNAGKEKITMTIEEAIAPNEEESPFATQDGTVQNVGNNAYYGDINRDGSADFADAVMLIRYDIGLMTFTDQQKKFGDVNGDGEVDFADAIRIMRFDAGFISKLR